MIMPNFLIVGAAKAGTTALYTYLKQHPQVYTTPQKETSFFAFEGEPIDFQGPGDNEVAEYPITDLATYQQQFQGVNGEQAIGEACPVYLYHPQAARRIHHYLPNVRLIAILRNPIDRAYTNYLHLIREGRETETDFMSALQAEPQRIKDNWMWFWYYTKVGYYAEQLQRYYQLFDRSQIQVYLYEDLQRDASGLLQNIFRFLEVDDRFVPDFTIRPNKSGIPKNKLLHQLLTTPNPLKAAVKPLIPPVMRQKIQHQNLAKPTISLKVRQELTKLFRDDILTCQDLIERDLSAWLEVSAI